MLMHFFFAELGLPVAHYSWQYISITEIKVCLIFFKHWNLSTVLICLAFQHCYLQNGKNWHKSGHMCCFKVGQVFVRALCSLTSIGILQCGVFVLHAWDIMSCVVWCLRFGILEKCGRFLILHKVLFAQRVVLVISVGCVNIKKIPLLIVNIVNSLTK